MAIVIFSNSIILKAQQRPRCGTTEYQNFLEKEYPQLITIKQEKESQAKSYLQSKSLQERSIIINIPIVVHLIGNNICSKITLEKINEQISILNQDYRGANGIGADTKIEFCLAVTDPSGDPTDGILKFTEVYDEWDPDMASSASNSNQTLKSISHWPPEKYLNLYVADLVSPLLGYSSFPWDMSGVSDLDGVVIDPDCFGNTLVGNYNLGRTATHEIGHWLGLYHTFEKGTNESECLNTDCKTNGDLICDTPPVWNWNKSNDDTDDGPNYGCVSGTNTCHTDSPDLPDQIENYMDYTDDACMNKFTADQVTRMSYILEHDRLYTSLQSCTEQCGNKSLDGDETGIDCGGTSCYPCEPSHCNNGTMDQSETGIDCGGSDCNPCPTTNPIPGCIQYLFGYDPISLNGQTSTIPCIEGDIIITPYPYWGEACNEWYGWMNIRNENCGDINHSKYCDRRLFGINGCDCGYLSFTLTIIKVDANLNQIAVLGEGTFEKQVTIDKNSSEGYRLFGKSIVISAPILSMMGISSLDGGSYQLIIGGYRGGQIGYPGQFTSIGKYFNYISSNSISKSGNIQYDLSSKINIVIAAATISNPIEVVAGNSIQIKPNTRLTSGHYYIATNGCNNNTKSLNESNLENTESNYNVYNNRIGSKTEDYNTPENQLINTNNSDIVIYPNPTDGFITIDLKQLTGISKITLTNNLGVELFTKIVNEPITSLNLSEFPVGLYFIKIQVGEQVIIKKVVKR